MIETITGIFLTVWLMFATWHGLGIVFLLSVFFFDDVDQKFLTAFVSLALATTALSLFTPPLWVWLLSPVLYFGVGLGWSVFRFRHYLIQKRIEFDAIPNNDSKYSYKNDYLSSDLSDHSSRIAWWVAAWPLSATKFMLIDIIDNIKLFVVTTGRKLYESQLAKYGLSPTEYADTQSHVDGFFSDEKDPWKSRKVDDGVSQTMRREDD